MRHCRTSAIDPYMSDLLYCVEGDTKDQTKFRYTQDQRRKETQAKEVPRLPTGAQAGNSRW